MDVGFGHGGSISPSPVSWFEIPARDFDRARRFYESIFEVKLVIDVQPVRRLARFPGGAGQPGGAVVHDPTLQCGRMGVLVYLGVTDPVTEVLQRVTASGGCVVKHATDIGPWGTLAIFEDLEGNQVGIHRWCN